MDIRSFLCAPPGKYDILPKARLCGAHVAHFDLEDSVPGNKKAHARKLVLAQLRGGAGMTTAVRMNALNSEDGLKDILTFTDEAVVPDILICPKMESADSIRIVIDILKPKFPGLKVFAIIETIKGLKALDSLAGLPGELDGLIFGAADFARDLGRIPASLDLRQVRGEIALTANEIGALAVDSPCFAVRDTDTLIAELHDARALGYHAKIAIHPNQVDIINRTLSPNMAELDFAREVMAGIQAIDDTSTSGITTVDDTMVGPPFLKLAKRILEQDKQG